MAGLAVALAYFAFDKFVLEPQREASEQQLQAERLAAATEEAREEGRGEALLESYGDRSIAVLPFDDMSPDGDQEYLSDGIAEELLNLLARVPDLRVISRTSSFAFKGQALEVPEIARRLKVGYVLEGSVRKAGNQVRITAQLIEARSDTHVWSENYDRELVNVFAIQDEIAAKVVDELQLTLFANLQQGLKVDERAYELVLRGRHLLHQFTPETAQRAEAMFEQAIAMDPDYAQAHAGMAEALRQQHRTPWEERRPRMEAAIDRALELEPGQSEALTIKGLLNWQADIGVARELWKQAVAQNPNNSEAYRRLAQSYIESDSTRYLEYSRKAYQVDPTSWVAGKNLAFALTRFGRYDEAMSVAGDFHYINPDSIQPFDWFGDFHFRSGNIVELVKLCYALYRRSPGEIHHAWLPLVFMNLGEYELAMEWALETERRVADYQFLGPWVRALITNTQGDPDEALRLVAEAAERTGNGFLIFHVPVAHALFKADFESARAAWEGFMTGPDGAPKRIDPEENLDWPVLTTFALTLQRTGEEGFAQTLIDDLDVLLGKHLSNGVVWHKDFGAQFLAALLDALSGRNREAIEHLRLLLSQEVANHSKFIRRWHHFDGLRGDPEFEALVAEGLARLDAQRQHLEEEGLLLTPEEVMALDNYEYDPFSK
jgi:TolB-like protein